MDTRTKIVATLGPTSTSPAVLDELLLAGTDVVRLNLSHGTLATHLATLQAVREAAERTGRTVAVLADLPGPKVRSAPFPEGGVELRSGDAVFLVAEGDVSTEQRVPVDYPTLLADLVAGDRVVFGDGAISLEVVAVGEHAADCRVLNGGRLQGRPGVHLPSERLRLTTPTADDIVLGRAMADAGVDFLAVSFVRSAQDLRVLREALAPRHVRRVAKIETMSAVADMDDIVVDLGCSIPAVRAPL
jgi:pyruvate kinase